MEDESEKPKKRSLLQTPEEYYSRHDNDGTPGTLAICMALGAIILTLAFVANYFFPGIFK